MSASCTSRVRLEVSTTSGGTSARIVPSSGIVTALSASTSSRKASNSSSARSISSTSSTDGRCSIARQDRAGDEEPAVVERALQLGLVQPRRRSPLRPRAGAAPAAGSPSRRGPARRRCPRSTAAEPARRAVRPPGPGPGWSCRRRRRPPGTADGACAKRGRPRSPGPRRAGSPRPRARPPVHQDRPDGSRTLRSPVQHAAPSRLDSRRASVSDSA